MYAYYVAGFLIGILVGIGSTILFVFSYHLPDD